MSVQNYLVNKKGHFHQFVAPIKLWTDRPSNRHSDEETCVHLTLLPSSISLLSTPYLLPEYCYLLCSNSSTEGAAIRLRKYVSWKSVVDTEPCHWEPLPSLLPGSLRTCSSSAGEFCLGVCMQQVLSLKTKTNSCIYGRGLCLAHTECLLEVVEKKRVKCQAHMQGYFECYCNITVRANKR